MFNIINNLSKLNQIDKIIDKKQFLLHKLQNKLYYTIHYNLGIFMNNSKKLTLAYDLECNKF